MTEIHLSQGKIAIIDNCDAHLAQYKWYFGPSGYASRHFKITPGRKGKRGMVFLHHAIMGRPLNKMEIDHVNGNRLDCRRNNLRIVTRRENTSNQKCHRGEKPKSSKYIGVHYFKACKSKNWCAKIRLNGKNRHLGLFFNEYDAHLAYQEALKNAYS